MNNAPKIVPALRNWSGTAGFFRLVPDTSLHGGNAAYQTSLFIGKLFGISLPVNTEEHSRTVCFIQDACVRECLGSEGYTLTVTEQTVTVTAATEIGLLYGGITLAQGFVSSGNMTFPCGTATDYPAYPVRSGMLDVARAYIPMHKLLEVGKYMAWFKLNELHVHINDTGKHGYHAFRLESDVHGLTSRDGFYTKQEYRAFQKELASYGIKVITEIDTPYHASCFSEAADPPEFLTEADNVPWWCVGKCLDIRDRATVDFVKNLFTEYLEGDDPVFQGDTVHIGMDEYPASMKSDMTAYVKEIVSHVNSHGYKARFWSGLAVGGCMNRLAFAEETNVQLAYWDFGLSGAAETVAEGFPIVNCVNAYLYIVPGNAEAKLGGYTDIYHNEDYKLIYERWQANMFSLYAAQKELLPADDKRMLGACFSIWNDSHSAYLGLTYRDVIDRVRESACLLSEKTWCGEQTKEIAFDDFFSRVQLLSDHAGNADPFERASKTIVGFPNETELELLISELPQTQTDLLASNDGHVRLYLAPDGTLGFSTAITETEFNVFAFDYRLPIGKSIALRLVCDRFRTVLYAEGERHPAINRREHMIADADKPKGRYSTFAVPTEQINKDYITALKIIPKHLKEETVP